MMIADSDVLIDFLRGRGDWARRIAIELESRGWPRCAVLHALDTEQLRKTCDLVKRFADQGLTLADAHGLIVMAERRVVVLARKGP